MMRSMQVAQRYARALRRPQALPSPPYFHRVVGVVAPGSGVVRWLSEQAWEGPAQAASPEDFVK